MAQSWKSQHNEVSSWGNTGFQIRNWSFKKWKSLEAERRRQARAAGSWALASLSCEPTPERPSQSSGLRIGEGAEKVWA